MAESSQSQEIFSRGSITRIRMTNFLTYDDVEVKPGAGLNVIVGPNGTGKSTIVCAICIGLGGHPSILGRSNNLIDYIKHGCDEAKIEIELSDKRNAVIERTIKNSNNKLRTEWKLDSKNISEKEIKAKIDDYKIQINNLCQFLAQDKVVDFSKQTPVELLESTEKTVVNFNEANLFELHQQLKAEKSDGQSVREAVERLQRDLQQAENRCSDLEQIVQNVYRRRQLESSITLYKKKRAFAEYEDGLKGFKQLQQESKEADRKLNELESELQPLMDQIKVLKVDSKKLQQKWTELNNRVTSFRSQLRNLNEQFERRSDAISSEKNQIKEAKHAENQRKKVMHDLEAEIRALEEEKANIVEVDVQSQIDELKQRLRELQSKEHEFRNAGESFQSDIEKIDVEINRRTARVNNLEGQENQRLRAFRSAYPDAHSAFDWYKGNKNRFKGEIHPPIMLCVRLLDPAYAPYVESLISWRDMCMFVCEEGDDSALFLKECRDNRGWRINCAVAPPFGKSDFTPPVMDHRMRRFGFSKFVSELFEAPDAVKRFLCSLSRLHLVPLGSDETDKDFDRAIEYLKGTNFKQFITPTARVTIKISRYTGQPSTLSAALKESKLLKPTNQNDEEIKELKDEIKQLQIERRTLSDEMKQMEQQLLQVKTERVSAQQEKSQLEQQANQKVTLETRIRAKKQTLDRKKSEPSQYPEVEQRCTSKIKNLIQEKLRFYGELVAAFSQLQELILEMGERGAQIAQKLRKLGALETIYNQQSQELEDLQKRAQDLRDQCRTLKEELRQKLNHACEMCGVKSGPSINLPQELMDEFKNITNNIEELDQLIAAEKARLDFVQNADESALEEFEEAKEQKQSLERELTKKQSEQNTFQQRMDRQRNEWLIPLKTLVDKLSSNFSKFFSVLGCAGEVELTDNGKPDDFSNYGLKVKVKFRSNEPLRELNAMHQSGGERSVSTIFFILALQELSKVPFRCVDEINQGMDAENERRVFDMMVEMLSGSNKMVKLTCSQYFMLTPKLLPNLNYGHNLKLLFVYNGPHMTSKWNTPDIIERKRRLNNAQQRLKGHA